MAWNRKITPEDEAFIKAHPEMSDVALANFLGLHRCTIYKARKVQSQSVCAGRPQACFDCPFPECRLDDHVELTEDEYSYIDIGMEDAEYDKN